VDNRKWKKVIIGKGNASKSEIMDFSISQWGDLFPEQDYADAACIALWRKRDGR
jgi:Holliday junction resolvasome RuvABC endonuclease subunit